MNRPLSHIWTELSLKFRELVNNGDILPLSLILIGVCAYFISTRVDTYGGFYDDYALMDGVRKGFLSYVTGSVYILPLTVYYWSSNRIFGGSLSDYLVLPYIFGILTLVMIFLGVKRFWQSPWFTMIILGLTVFNNQLIYLTEYSMFTYLNSFFLSVCLYFLLLKIAFGNLNSRHILYLTLISIPMAFFSNLYMVIPIVIGIPLAITYRWYVHNRLSNFSQLFNRIITFSPLIIVPLAVYFLVYTVHPFENLGVDKRPEMAAFYLKTSGLSQNFQGAIQFSLKPLPTIFKDALLPAINTMGLSSIIYDFVRTVNPYLLFATLPILIIFILIPLWNMSRHRIIDSKVVFTAIYIGLIFAGMAIGGILGISPYGNLRYTIFIIFPLIVITGYVLYFISSWWIKRIVNVDFIHNNVRRGYLAASFLILVIGTGFNLTREYAVSERKRENKQAIDYITNLRVDMLLYDEAISPMFKIKTPLQFHNSQSLGWGIKWNAQHGQDTGASALSHLSESNTNIQKVAVISWSDRNLESLPNCREALKQYYHQIDQVQSPNIWVGLFEHN